MKPNIMTSHYKQTAHRMRGVGLVELMIGMTIGLFLILGVLEVFASTRASYRTQEALSRIQESGRFAVNFLSRDVRMAGYAGCVRNAPVTNTLDQANPAYTSLAYDFTVGIEGFDNVTTAVGGISPTPTSGTDMFVIRRAGDGTVKLVSPYNNSSQLFVQDNGVTTSCPGNTTGYEGLCTGDILMVTDCQKSRVFQATNVTATGGAINAVHSNSNLVTPGNGISSWGGASAPATEQFGLGAEIVKVVSRVYFVATGANGEPSLWMRENGAASQELVEGVENMQILYDLDTDVDGVLDQFGRTGAQVTTANNWAFVAGAKIELMIRSRENGVVSAVQTFPYNGANFTAPDRRLRKVFTPYITLRNRTN